MAETHSMVQAADGCLECVRIERKSPNLVKVYLTDSSLRKILEVHVRSITRSMHLKSIRLWNHRDRGWIEALPPSKFATHICTPSSCLVPRIPLRMHFWTPTRSPNVLSRSVACCKLYNRTLASAAWVPEYVQCTSEMHAFAKEVLAVDSKSVCWDMPL